MTNIISIKELRELTDEKYYEIVRQCNAVLKASAMAYKTECKFRLGDEEAKTWSIRLTNEFKVQGYICKIEKNYDEDQGENITIITVYWTM